MRFFGWTLGLLTAISILAEEPNEKAGKYHSMLEKRPSSGYLFDRFYNAWLDTGTIEGLGEFLKKEADADDAGMGDRLLLAWYFAKQGEDAGALEVFKQALKDDPENSEAWFEKARIEARTLNFEAAVADLNKAQEAGAKSELAIKIAKLKGQLLIRDGKNEEALATWKALLAENGDDEELYEDVIELQIEEGLYDEAVATSKALVDQTKDPYKKVLRQLRMGDVFQRAGKRDEALAAYETSLKQVGNGTWIEKEILSQIEQVFRREDDVTGLAERLKALAGEDGKRISIQRRYAEVLMESGKEDEAVALFEKIIALTPGERKIREEYIDLLSKAGEFEKAIPQLEALIEQNAQDGELLIRLAALQHSAEKSEVAGQTLRKFLSQSDGSEYAHLRVARLEEQYELLEASEVTYRKILEAFPESVAAQETFATFLHRNDRKEEALEMWRKIASEGDRAQAIRIARTLASRLEHEAAFKVLEARFDELQNDPVYLGQLIVEALVLDKDEEAIPWAIRRVNLIEEPVDLEGAVKQAAIVIGKSERKAELINELRGKENRTVQETCLVAELLENEGDYDSVDALLAGSENPNDLLILTQKIRSLRQRELWERAADATKDLIEGPGGRKSVFVRNLVTLYERAGKVEEAMKWIPEWKSMSPGSIEPWMTEANLLRGEQKGDEAIQVLRLAANKFEDDTTVKAELAQLYAEEGKSADAQRIFQRLYDDGESLSDKLQWVGRLASTAQNLGKLDTLVEEFEERQKSNRESVAPLMALAEMHRTTGDYEERRKSLMEAARLKPDDVGFLFEISRIEESEGDWRAALETLEKAKKIDDSTKVKEQIAALKLRNGEEEEAYRELEMLAKENMDADMILKLAEAIATRYDWERLNEFLEPWLVEFPKDYRLHYLRAIALEEAGETPAAVDAFLSLLGFEEELPKKMIVDPLKRQLAAMPTEVPDGMLDFWRFRQSTYQAYRHRQNRGNYGGISYGGIRGSGSAVSQPPTVDYVATYAMAHLNGLLPALDEEQTAEVKSKLDSSGEKNAAIMSQLTFDPNRYSFQIPEELLDEYPENEALHAFWVESNQNNVTADFERFQHAFDLLAEKYPRYGLTAAMGGARQMAEGSPAMLANALKIIKQVEDPDYSMFYMLTRLVSQSVQVQNQGMELTKEQRDGLLDLAVEWYPEVMDGNAQNQSYIFRSMASLLRMANRTDEFLKVINDRIEDAKKQNLGYSLSPYRGNQGSRLVGALPFPNYQLSEIPQEVLYLFQSNSAPVSFATTDGEIEEVDTPIEMAAKAKHPMVKLMLLVQGAAEDEKIGEVVKSMTDTEKPSLNSAMLAAGWAARQGEYADVVKQLSKAKFLPMSRTERQKLDGAIVHAAIELGEDNKEALEAGQAAALRLRHGRLMASQRQELASIMSSLGLEEEAERQEEKLAVAMNRALTAGSSASMAAGYSQPQNNQNRFEQLIAQDKKEVAVKEAARALQQWGLAASNPQAGNDWVYYSREMKSQLAKLKMMSDVMDFLKESKRNTRTEQLQYAGVQLIMGEKEEALKAYQEILENNPNESGAQFQTAVLLAEKDPEAAGELIKNVDPTLKQQIGYALSQQIGNQDSDKFDEMMATVRLSMELLRDVEFPERQDFSWVMQPFQKLVSVESVEGINLPHLYLSPEKRKENEEAFNKSNPSPQNKAEHERIKELNQKRRELHDEMCGLMLKLPQLASGGFVGRHSIALVEEKPDDSLKQLAIDALKLEATATNARDLQMSAYLNNTDAVPLIDPYGFLAGHYYEEKDRDGFYDTVIPEIKKSGRNGRNVARRLELLGDLFFDDADKFATNTKLYTNAVTQLGVNISYEFPRIVEVMRKRKLPTDQILKIVKDRAQTLLSQNNRPSNPEIDLIELIYDRDGEDAAIEIIEELGDLWLGPREKRKEFVEKNYDPNNRYNTTQSRNIYNFAYFIRYVTDREKLMFIGLEYCERYSLPREGWPYFFHRSTNFKGGEKVASWLKRSPFIAKTPAELEIYLAPLNRRSSGRESIFEEVIYGLTRYSDDASRKVVSAELEKLDGFGAEVLLASLDRNKPQQIVSVAAKYGDAIKGIENEEHRLELIGFLDRTRSKVSKSHKWDKAEDKAFIAYLDKATAGLSNERVDALMNAKRFSDLKLDSSGFDNHVVAIMREVGVDDPDKSKAVFYKACELVDDARKSNQWRSSYSDGQTFGGHLLNDFCNGSGEIPHLKIVTDIAVASEPVRVSIYGTAGGLDIDDNLYTGYNRIKNESSNDSSIAIRKLLLELHKNLDPKSIPLVGIDIPRFSGRLSSDDRKLLLKVADEESEGKPHSAWAREMAMAIRFYLAADKGRVDQYVKNDGDSVPEPTAFVEYYQQQITDDAYPVSLRVAAANNLLSESHLWPDEFRVASFKVLNEAFGNADIPVRGYTIFRIANHFAGQSFTDAEQEMAVEFLDAWRDRNRFNGAPSTSGKGYRPGSTTILSAFKVAAVAGKNDVINRMLVQHRSNLDDSTAALVHLIANGHVETAFKLFRASYFKYSPVSSTSTPYDDRLDKAIPAFLELVKDEDQKFLAETFLKLGVDPKEEDKPEKAEAEEIDSPRVVRAKALAGKLKTITFKNEAVKERCINLIVAVDEAAPLLSEELVAAFEKVNFNAISSIEDYTAIREAVKMPMIHAFNQIKEGNPDPMIKVWNGINEGSAQSYYRSEALEPIVDKMRGELLESHSKPKVAKAWLAVLETIYEKTDDDIYNRLYRLKEMSSEFMVLAIVTGADKELFEWAAAIEGSRSARFEAGIKERKILVSTLRKVVNPENGDPSEMPIEPRLTYVKQFLTSSYRQKLQGRHGTLLTMMAQKCLSPEELFKHEEELVSIHPRDGLAVLDVINVYRKEQRYEDGLKKLGAGLTELKPTGNVLNRFRISKAELLRDLDRKDEAIAELKSIPLITLDKGTRSVFNRVAKSLKYTPPKQEAVKKRAAIMAPDKLKSAFEALKGAAGGAGKSREEFLKLVDQISDTAIQNTTQGDCSSFLALWKSMADSKAPDEWLITGYQSLVSKVGKDAIKAHSNGKVAEQWATAIEFAITDTKAEIISEIPGLEGLASDHLVMSVASGNGDRVTKFYESLSPERAGWYITGVRRNNGMIKKLAEIQPQSSGERVEFSVKYLSNPVYQKAQPGYHSTFKQLISEKCLTPEDLFENKEKLIAAHPRNGTAYLDLAKVYYGEKNYDAALASLDAGLQKHQPVGNKLAYFQLEKTEILRDAGRIREAKQTLHSISRYVLDNYTSGNYARIEHSLKSLNPEPLKVLEPGEADAAFKNLSSPDLNDRDAFVAAAASLHINALDNLNNGQPETFTKLWNLIANSKVSREARIEALEALAASVDTHILNAYRNPNTIPFWIEALQFAISSTGDEIIGKLDVLSKLTADYVILAYTTGKIETVPAWLDEGLPEKRQEWFRSSLLKNKNLTDRFSRLINPDNKEIYTLDEGPRLTAVLSYLSDPVLYEFQPVGKDNIFARLAERCLSGDELFEHHKKLTEAWPENGPTGLMLAGAERMVKHYDQAIKIIDAELAEEGKITGNRLGRYLITKAELLNISKEKEKGLAVIKTVDLKVLDEPTRAFFDRVAAQLGYKPG